MIIFYELTNCYSTEELNKNIKLKIFEKEEGCITRLNNELLKTQKIKFKSLFKR